MDTTNSAKNGWHIISREIGWKQASAAHIVAWAENQKELYGPESQPVEKTSETVLANKRIVVARSAALYSHPLMDKSCGNLRFGDVVLVSRFSANQQWACVTYQTQSQKAQVGWIKTNQLLEIQEAEFKLFFNDRRAAIQFLVSRLACGSVESAAY